MVEIEDDVQNVANSLHQIDPCLRLRWSEAGGYFCVYYKPDSQPEGHGYIVTTAQELDHRLVKQVEQVYWKCMQPGYSYADELDKLDAAREKQLDDEFSEKTGEAAEKLAHALRQDRGVKSKVFVP